MAENPPPPARPIVRRLGGCLAVFFLAGGLCMVPAGIYGMLGQGRAMSFDCTRATGECVLHERIDRPIPLDTIRSADVTCGDVHIATNTDEWQCEIRATLVTGATQSLSEGSGDATSEAEYRAAAAQITAFLADTTPTLHVAYTVREGTTSVLNELLLGAFCLGIGWVAAYWLWKTRRPA
jgi:hypothetical protein